MKYNEENDEFYSKRLALVQHLRLAGIQDKRVLEAMMSVPRHVFVEEEYKAWAYNDNPLPIKAEQTISQPFIVAQMTEVVLGGQRLHTVLEVGSGSGYQAAVLSELVDQVYSIERIQSLADLAALRLKSLGIDNVKVRFGDGYMGWNEYAPYDGILVTAAASEVPQTLLEQMVEGGRMVIPVGEKLDQRLMLYIRQKGRFEIIELEPVRFVPLITGVR